MTSEWQELAVFIDIEEISPLELWVIFVNLPYHDVVSVTIVEERS